MFKKPLAIDTLIFFVTLAVLHYFATTQHLYWIMREFDSLIHFLGGFTLALFFSWLYFFSELFNPKIRNLTRFALVTILGTLFVGISWETYELIFNKTMVAKIDYPLDLVMDLIMDFLGALAGCFYAYIKEYNRKIIFKNSL